MNRLLSILNNTVASPVWPPLTFAGSVTTGFISIYLISNAQQLWDVPPDSFNMLQVQFMGLAILTAWVMAITRFSLVRHTWCISGTALTAVMTGLYSTALAVRAVVGAEPTLYSPAQVSITIAVACFAVAGLSKLTINALNQSN